MTEFRFAPAAPDEGTVYGSCAPDWGTRASDPVGEYVEYVQDRGVQRVLCLLSDRQVEDRPGLLDAYRDAFGPDRVRHVSIPDHTLPTTDRLAAALSFLRDAEAADERVVVHCLAGIGRTGVTLAAWLVAERGHDPEGALATVEEQYRRPTDAVRSGNATVPELHDLLRSVG